MKTKKLKVNENFKAVEGADNKLLASAFNYLDGLKDAVESGDYLGSQFRYMDSYMMAGHLENGKLDSITRKSLEKMFDDYGIYFEKAEQMKDEIKDLRYWDHYPISLKRKPANPRKILSY